MFDGKLLILHHIVDGFSCEGRPAPESILIREKGTDWFLIRNTAAKCASVDRLAVQGVSYDEAANQALYNGDLYVPPRPYFVSALENPNLPDVRLEDGICEDVNGVCSLRAAIEQAGTTSATESVVVNIPAATFTLNSPITLLSQFADSKTVTIRGADPITTVIDGGNSVVPLKIAMWTSATVTIENLTIQNGMGPGGFAASAIFPVMQNPADSQLDVINCIFKNNKGNAAIYGGVGSGNIRIRKTQFIGNQFSAIQVFGVSSLLVEDSSVTSSGMIGIWVENATSNVTVRRSTISNNAHKGIQFHRCGNCRIENTTVTQNQLEGLEISATVPDPNLDVVISHSTITENGLTSGANLSLGFYDSANKLFLSNSILSMKSGGKRNCQWLYPGNTHTIVATGNIFDDPSCEQSNTANILADPMLGSLANNGGDTQTLLPLPGSPAIDAGANGVCASEDQRGFPRPVDKLGMGLRCDIGALELQ